MRILLVNYHYFIYGGPDRYLFNVKELFEKNGNDVFVFSFNYQETIDNQFIGCFPEPITGYGKCMLSQNKITTKGKINAAKKMYINKEVDDKFEKMILHYKPDIIYSIYLSSTMLPSIFKIAKIKYNIPVIYRLSDFHLFCASYLFFRDGRSCNDCMISPLYALKNKCVKGSLTLTLLRVMQIYYMRVNGYYKYIDAYVCPSSFMKDIMLKSRYKEKEIYYIPTFAYDLQPKEYKTKKNKILFLGNVTREKGIEILINAYLSLNIECELSVAGKCDEKYMQYLMTSIPAEKHEKVIFKGFVLGDELKDLMLSAKILIHPVLWSENLPNSVIEAMSMGIPVIASRIGSMIEMIDHGENGYMFTAGEHKELAKYIMMLMNEDNYQRISDNARKKYLDVYSPDQHYKKIIEIFENKIV